MKITYPFTFCICYVLSLMPLRVLYRLSDVLSYFFYYCIRYKRKKVRENLTAAFPQKNATEINLIEKKFYAFFCDNLVETVKLFTISEEEMQARMVFEGIPQIKQDLERENKKFAVCYLAHFGNWEWASTLCTPFMNENKKRVRGQIYHPSSSEMGNQFLGYLRSRFAGNGLTELQSGERWSKWQQSGQKAIMGIFPDHSPPYKKKVQRESSFMENELSVYVSTENFCKELDALVYFAVIERTERGYYRCRIKRMVKNVRNSKECEVTLRYLRELERSIHSEPELWLWTHPLLKTHPIKREETCFTPTRQPAEEKMREPALLH